MGTLRALLAGIIFGGTTAAAGAAVLTDVSGFGGLFDKVLLVQPIHVCNSDASVCGPTAAHHPAVTIQTLAQARIATALLPMRSIVNDALLEMAMPTEQVLLNTPGNGQSSNVQTLNAWFVREILGQNEDGSTTKALGMVAGFPDPQGSTTPNGVLLRRLDERKAITFAHELAHALGAQHVEDDPDNLMAPGRSSNFKGALTAEQIAFMRTSGFLAAVPQIQLTTSVIRDDNGGSFTQIRIEHLATPGAAEVSLRELSIDMADYLYTQPGPAQRPATVWAGLQVLDDSTLSQPATLRYAENMVTTWPCGSCEEDPQTTGTGGLPELGIDFGAAGLAPGQSITLRLGITTNLRNEYETTEARSLADAAVDLHFDHGLSARSQLTDLAPAAMARQALLAGVDAVELDRQVFDLRHFSGIYTEGRHGNPFGAQYAPGSVARAGGAWEVEFVADAADDGDPPGAGRLPLPGSAWLALAALALALALASARSRSRPADRWTRCTHRQRAGTGDPAPSAGRFRRIGDHVLADRRPHASGPNGCRAAALCGHQDPAAASTHAAHRTPGT